MWSFPRRHNTSMNCLCVAPWSASRPYCRRSSICIYCRQRDCRIRRRRRSRSCLNYRVAQKTGPPYLIANILKIPRPNCVEIGELLQYYMLNTVVNFLFKNFIALWRHLAKTQLLCDAQIYLYNVNK